MPRVSVIIPAYNAEAQIAETVRSVEGQGYGDWEVVVADDGSTDGTAGAVSSFGGRVKLVRSPGNLGPANARNLAISHSVGELVALLDADDYWLPDFLAEQVALYDRSQERFGNVGIVACNARILGAEGFAEHTYADRVPFPEELTLTQLLKYNPIYVSALSPRAVVDEAGGFSAECFGSEDHDLWIRILELGYRVVRNPKPLVVYRLGSDSVSASAGRMARTMQATYRRALERGRLTRRQRRIAHRKLRLQRAIEKLDAIFAERRERGRLPYGRLARALPLLAVVAAEHPHRWGSALRMLSHWGAARDALLAPR
jgi:glycosyltransferase involved in cell wall biosynthesis